MGVEAGFNNIVEWVVGVPPRKIGSRKGEHHGQHIGEPLCGSQIKQRLGKEPHQSVHGAIVEVAESRGVLQGLQIKTCLLVHVPQLWNLEVSLGGAVHTDDRMVALLVGPQRNWINSRRGNPKHSVRAHASRQSMAGHATERVVGDF